MCFGCYEDAGKPVIVTPATRRVAALCKRLYELSGVGGNCHIVTDDWNLQDSGIAFCRQQVANGGGGDERTGQRHNDDPKQLAVERELLELMAPMSEAERASALALWAGYFKAPDPPTAEASVTDQGEKQS